jgi:hypothetical protein
MAGSSIFRIVRQYALPWTNKTPHTTQNNLSYFPYFEKKDYAYAISKLSVCLWTSLPPFLNYEFMKPVFLEFEPT